MHATKKEPERVGFTWWIRWHNEKDDKKNVDKGQSGPKLAICQRLVVRVSLLGLSLHCAPFAEFFYVKKFVCLWAILSQVVFAYTFTQQLANDMGHAQRRRRRGVRGVS